MKLPALLATLIPLSILTACTTAPPVECDDRNPKKPPIAGSCNEGHATPLLRRPKPPLTHGQYEPLLRPEKKWPRRVLEPIEGQHDGNSNDGSGKNGSNSGTSTGGGGYTHGQF